MKKYSLTAEDEKKLVDVICSKRLVATEVIEDEGMLLVWSDRNRPGERPGYMELFLELQTS